MLILALDTCFGACSAALYDAAADRVLADHCVLMDKGHAEALPPMVQRCFADAGKTPADVQRVVVTRGPGTFTGLRIGLSLAHGMASALGCEIVGIDSLTATAAPVLKQHPQVLVLQQAGATGCFYAGIMSASAPDPDLHFAAPETCRNLARNGMPIIGTGAAAFPEFAAQFLLGHDFPRAAQFAPLAAARPASSSMPMPLYLREPDAKPSVSAPTDIHIRSASAEDAEDMARLHGLSFDTGWSAPRIAQSLALPGAGGLVLTVGGTTRAFVQFQAVVDEAEIHVICTEPRWRKRGFAARLLQQMEAAQKASGITKLHLEVAADNTSAITLYRSQGFAMTGRRAGYYTRKDGSSVDAVLMAKEL